MALSDLTRDKRFERLVYLLGLPIPHVLGHYELLLHSAWINRTLDLGDTIALEQTAMWPVKQQGELRDALLVCGRPTRRPGFIEKVAGKLGHFKLADPPHYLQKRIIPVFNRACLACNKEFETFDPRQNYHNNACKQLAKRARKLPSDTDLVPNVRVATRVDPCRDRVATRSDTDNNTPPHLTEEKKMDTHPQPPQGGEGVVCEQLVSKWYQEWGSGAAVGVDHDKAGEMIEQFGDDAWAVIPHLVKIVRKRWADCRLFSGALTYLPDALQALKADQYREKARQSAEAERRAREATDADQRAELHDLAAKWEELPDPTQHEIRRLIMAEKPEAPEGFIQRLCLEELAARLRTGRL